VEKPDEWRIDLESDAPGHDAQVQQVAQVAATVLADLGAVGWPKTSGGKGLHVYVRIEPRWGFATCGAGARVRPGGERRAGELVDLTWWRKDRDPASVFVDYTRTPGTTPSAAPTRARGARAVVSAPITWDELPDADGRLHHRHHAGPVAELATCTPASTTRCTPWTSCSNWAERTRRRGAAPPPDEDA